MDSDRLKKRACLAVLGTSILVEAGSLAFLTDLGCFVEEARHLLVPRLIGGLLAGSPGRSGGDGA